jgi:hypothetical protein
MTTTLKYTLTQITDLSFSGFQYQIPEDTVSMINYLCSHVGSEGLSSTIFTKNEESRYKTSDAFAQSASGIALGGFKPNSKKRKGNKAMEVSAEEWETIRTFQPTKMEQKSGVDGEIDQIRLLINKLSDKTFLDIREKIIDKINAICSDNPTAEQQLKIATIIYDISSTNKFYSRIFADLYAELLTTYKWLRTVFDEKFANIMAQYQNIEYVDPETNYDGFCDMNKANEKRKAVTTFFVNLANNGFIKKDVIIELLAKLLNIVMGFIERPDKKNEVDELTENIAILYNKEQVDEAEEEEQYSIDGNSILNTVNKLAKSKAKDYPSLSNKAIFKYMDLVEM